MRYIPSSLFLHVYGFIYIVLIDGSNDLMETAVPNIDPTRIAWPDDGMHKEKDISFETIVEYLEKGRIVIGNVNEGGHFVLITGYYSGKNGIAYIVCVL